MLNKIIAFYDKKVRRIIFVHKPIHAIVWKGSNAAVKALSVFKNFEIPPDKMLPFLKLGMLIGTYEAGTVKVCKELIKPGMIVLDIGAHAGYFTRIFSHIVGSQGRVLAFEPHPVNYEVLKRNVERWRLNNVILIRKAVSNKEGNAVFYETIGSFGHSLHSEKPHINQFKVEITLLDKLLPQIGVKEVHFVKMDIEGHEPEALDGMNNLIKRQKQIHIILEFKPSLLRTRNYEPASLIEKLFQMGFEVFAIGRKGKLLQIRSPDMTRFIQKCNLLATKTKQSNVFHPL